VIRRLGSATLAVVALGAALTTLLPQHAASFLLLAAGTLVVVAAAFVLVLAGPLVTAVAPVTALDVGPGPGAPTLEPQGLRHARRDLAARATTDPAATAELVRRLLDDPDHVAPHGGHR
jgi:hypothetical protein